MASTLRPYLSAVRHTLEAAICLMHFPSVVAERQERPEVEVHESEVGVLKPILIRRDTNEMTLIEVAVNSVRVSIKIRQSDRMETMLLARHVKFLQKRAENFKILRRKAVEGYDVSFLITAEHLLQQTKASVINFIVDMMERFDADVKQLKLDLHCRLRGAAVAYHQALIRE